MAGTIESTRAEVGAPRTSRFPISGRRVERLPWYVAIGSFAAIVVATAVRLHFGVDFTDESFYIAIPYRLVRGARPFVDETSIFELPAAVLTYPFVFAYYHLVGVRGIVLFMRHIDLAFTLLVAALVWRALRAIRGSRATSIVIASIAVAYVPFGIHGLSYNSLGAGFLCAGLFMLLAGLSKPSRPKSMGASSLLGLAVFTYPAFILAGAFSLLAAGAFSWRRERRLTIIGFSTFALWCALAVAFFFQRGWSTTATLYHRAKLFGGQGGGLHKVLDVASGATRHSHPYLVIAVIAAAILLRRTGRADLSRWALCAIPFFALVRGGSWTSANAFVTNMALLAPLLFVALRAPRAQWPLMAVVWLPAVIAGESAGFGSSNGAVNFGIGAFPGALASLVILCDAVEDSPKRSRRMLTLIPALVAAVTLTVFQYTYVYRDSGFGSLRHEVAGGPFAGLYTSPDHLTLIRDLHRDLTLVSGPSCTIMFYRQFPAGYLFDAGAPLTNRAFVPDVAPSLVNRYERIWVAYYRSKGWPDVVVQMANAPAVAGESYVRPTPLERVLTGHGYQLVGFRFQYKTYRRTGVTCQ